MVVRWRNANNISWPNSPRGELRRALMKRRIAVGVDIGTYQVKIVVVEELYDKNGVRQGRVLGTGIAESKGLRHGYIVDQKEVSASILRAKKEAESVAHIPIRSAFLAIGGISLDEARATGSTIISRADQEITVLDIEKAGKAAREVAAPGFLNRRVLHSIPLEYRIDGAKVLGDPIGMKGIRLEADYLFVTCLAQHEEALSQAVEDADIEVIGQMASPLAGSFVLLEGDQKMKGCVLANIGAETISIVVYDEGIPISIKVFPMGSSHITNDIALGLRISIEEAERVKIGRLSGQMYPRKKVDSLIETRLMDMFALIDKHLKSLGHRGPLPAGIIISGGGSGVGSISEIARGSLKLPSRLAELRILADTKIRDATWAVAYGIAIWGLTDDTTVPKQPFWEVIKKFFQQFLP